MITGDDLKTGIFKQSRRESTSRNNLVADEQAKEIESGKLDLGNSVRSHTETYAVYQRQLHIRIEALYTTVSVRFAKQRIEQGQCARALRRQIEFGVKSMRRRLVGVVQRGHLKDMPHLLDLRRLRPGARVLVVVQKLAAEMHTATDCDVLDPESVDQWVDWVDRAHAHWVDQPS